LGRLIAEGALKVVVGGETVRLDGFVADIGEPAGAEVLVSFDPPDRATLDNVQDLSHIAGRGGSFQDH